MRKDGLKTKKRILSVCVRLFLEQGYEKTSVSQIVKEANVSKGSYQNSFHTKDSILMELVESMFDKQFNIARSTAGDKLPPVYIYAVETAIQLTLTELNENLRELYIKAYSIPSISEYIFQHTAKELKKIFSSYLPDYAESDFYEMEIGTAGVMRNYMIKKCDMHFSLEKKLQHFLNITLRAYSVPEEEVRQVLAFVNTLDIRKISGDVMQHLFAMLEMKFDFKLSSGSEADTTAD